MPRCIFCGTEQDLEDLTDEHVFPAALGGALILKKGSCKDCNGRFSREFEQEFCRELALVRFLLRIPDRYGEVNALQATVEVEGKMHPAEIREGGELRIPPLKASRPLGEGLRETIYRAFSKGDSEKLKANLERKGIQVDQAPLADEIREIEATVQFVPDFLMSAAALRCVAKIAYTALAERAGIAVVLQSCFDPTREYIQTGRGESPTHLFFNANFAANFQIGPHQHAFVLVGNAKDRVCAGLVALFGSLFYFVIFSRAYDGADFACSTAYNAQTGEECKIIVNDLQNEFFILDDVMRGSTAKNDLSKSANHFIKVLCACLKIRIQSQD